MVDILQRLAQAEEWQELVQQSILCLKQPDRPIDVWGYYARGQLELGNYQAAVGGYQQIVSDVDSVELQMGYAQALLFSGAIEESKTTLLKLVSNGYCADELLLLLAVIAREEREYQEGISLLQKIENPTSDQALLLGHLYRDQQLYTEALLTYQAALKKEPQHAILQRSVQEVLSLHRGNLNEVNLVQESKMRRRLEKTWNDIQELPIDSPSRIHLQQALGNQNPDAPPVGYVAELFDQYADRFDDHLLDSLSYQAPQMVAAVLTNRYSSERPAPELLDLGVGTGLLGELVADMVDCLIGVDVSERMLQRASEKGFYQQLIQQDLVHFLRETNERYQVIALTDTLVYLGDLRGVINGIQRCLRPTGHCVLTVEKGLFDDYQLHFTGRYSHSLSYIHRLATESGLALTRHTEVKLRKGGGEWVKGLIIVLEHRR